MISVIALFVFFVSYAAQAVVTVAPWWLQLWAFLVALTIVFENRDLLRR